MKSVLISIQPKWVEKIASGEKTIEVRKTRPKLETPFKCYIYCTKDKKDMFWVDKEIEYTDGLPKWLKAYHSRLGNSCVIGEFVCKNIDEWNYLPDYYSEEYGEKIYYINSVDGHATCLTYDEIENYGKGKTLYGWHISDLVIYDKPKELTDFGKPCNHKNDCGTCVRYIRRYRLCDDALTRPPQSWCYVESLGE